MATLDIKRRVEAARKASDAHGLDAAGHLFRGDYSSAATSCHRAHQQRLIADALEAEVYYAEQEESGHGS